MTITGFLVTPDDGSVAFRVTRSDDGGTPSGATISATAEVGAAPIPHTHSLNGGRPP
jgi:hypothetical protein